MVNKTEATESKETGTELTEEFVRAEAVGV
jgi:hypothetical protein